MRFVQKVEISTPIKVSVRLQYQASVSPLFCIISVSTRLYVVVIYIYHFKRVVRAMSRKGLCSVKTVGIVTNFEMSDIRYFSPYPL